MRWNKSEINSDLPQTPVFHNDPHLVTFNNKQRQWRTTRKHLSVSFFTIFCLHQGRQPAEATKMQCGRVTHTMKWWSVTLMPIGGSKTWDLVWKCHSFVLNENYIISMSGIDWLNNLNVSEFFFSFFYVLCIFCLLNIWLHSMLSNPSFPEPTKSCCLSRQQANSSKLPTVGWRGSMFDVNPRLSEWLRSVSQVLCKTR